MSLALVTFAKAEDLGEVMVVGIAKNLISTLMKAHACFIATYRFTLNGRSLELLHKTEVDNIPVALSHFHGRLLTGVGSTLRLYDIGQRHILRKAEYQNIPNLIVSVQHL